MIVSKPASSPSSPPRTTSSRPLYTSRRLGFTSKAGKQAGISENNDWSHSCPRCYKLISHPGTCSTCSRSEARRSLLLRNTKKASIATADTPTTTTAVKQQSKKTSFADETPRSLGAAISASIVSTGNSTAPAKPMKIKFKPVDLTTFIEKQQLPKATDRSTDGRSLKKRKPVDLLPKKHSKLARKVAAAEAKPAQVKPKSMLKSALSVRKAARKPAHKASATQALQRCSRKRQAKEPKKADAHSTQRSNEQGRSLSKKHKHPTFQIYSTSKKRKGLSMPVRTSSVPVVSIDDTRVYYSLPEPEILLQGHSRPASKPGMTLHAFSAAPIVDCYTIAENDFRDALNADKNGRIQFAMLRERMVIEGDFVVINGGPSGIFFATTLCFYITQSGEKLVGLRWLLPRPEFCRCINQTASSLRPHYFAHGKTFFDFLPLYITQDQSTTVSNP